MPTTDPGYYKVNYRALSLRGVARSRGLLRLPLTFLVTRFKKPTVTAWMPVSWTELECAEEDLSERFWRATSQARRDFDQIGFKAVGFKKLTRILNPFHRDNGGINYLDPSRRCFGQIIYNRSGAQSSEQTEREHIVVAFTGCFKSGCLSFTNDKISPFDSPPGHEVVRRPSDGVAALYSKFLEEVARRTEEPGHFPDDKSLHKWFNLNQLEVFNHRVRSGLFIKMSESEIDDALRRIGRRLPAGDA
jgi:hypothetical protein